MCKCATFLHMFSSCGRIWSLVTLTAIRFRIFKDPLQSKMWLTISKMRKIVILEVGILFATCFTTTIYYYSVNNMSPSSICIFLSVKSSDFSKVFMTLFISVQLILGLLIIMLLYNNIALLMQYSGFIHDGPASSKRTIPVHVHLITITNVLFWLSSAIIYLRLMFSESVIPSWLIWLICLFSPHSIINGSIFLLGDSKSRKSLQCMQSSPDMPDIYTKCPAKVSFIARQNVCEDPSL